MRTEQELRDGVLDTFRSLISERENFPGIALIDFFSDEYLEGVKEEFEYLMSLWSTSCLKNEPTPTAMPEWLEKQLDIVSDTVSQWSEEKQKNFVESIEDYKEEDSTSIGKQHSNILLEALEDLAEGDCYYGDDCPTFGSRHGTCTSCKARKAIEEYKEVSR